MKLEEFMAFKTNKYCLEFDDNTRQYLNTLFNYKETSIKKLNNFNNINYKKQKINISNKINLILNKLNDRNILSLSNEFIDKIGYLTKEEYNTFQKCVIIKILNETNYIDTYIKFFIDMSYIYIKCFNYNNEYFFNIIEYIFDLAYSNIFELSDYGFVNKIIIDEDKRTNILLFINRLIEYNIMKEKITKYCESILLNDTNRNSIDIYYWYHYKKKLNSNDINNINTLLKEESIINNIRVHTLLEKLL